MSVSSAVILAAACSWNDPGVNAYRGDVPSAVHRYTDIPAEVRTRLQLRMERRQYDDVAVITRDSVQGRYEYADLRQMHFGRTKVCGYVDRSMWEDRHAERGLVYCEAEHCLIVPTVCRNVARVTRLQVRPVPPPPSDVVPMLPAVAPVQLVSVPEVPLLPTTSAVVDVPVYGGASARMASFAALTTQSVVPLTIVVPVPVISEPGTLLLAGLGLLVVLLCAARSKKS